MQWLRLGTGLLLAAFMVFMGLQKFGADNAVFDFIATQSGIALFEPVVRMATGVAELLAAVLILVGLFANRLRGVGGLFSLAVIGGALVFHLSPWLGIVAPVGYDEAGNYVFSPMLFMMAVAFFGVSAVVTFIEREHLPIIGKSA
ncbi:hypothetical protein RMQ97_05565 [Maricaulis sp. D1M11]|uniref:hypothetical protein n=1 Tax=Maricaulis sp. D1M11 TaxID=3076117 RepID=UPI0039B36F38